MRSESIRPEEAVRRVLSLPAARRAGALRAMLQGRPLALARALDLLPTVGTAPEGPLQSAQPAATAVRIGAFTLRSVLGEGGFGVVWLATQDEPLRRSVALKILRPDRLDSVSRARFETERRLLAMLNHPSLVKIFDAGESEDGRPWFSMELAEGAPITEACDAARLNIHDRMRLMADVARAVHHAHEHGLVHRDLKPANILLAFEADQTSVKVIDFGVAHETFTPSDPDEKAGAIIGTPGFLAPELVRLRINDPDVRTDIFALGAVLRRMLVGSDLGNRREGVLSALDVLEPNLQHQVAEDRHETISSLRHHVQGDLNAIVAHCLADDPRARYASALELAQDLDHFRHGEPVTARGGSLAYIGATAAKRHSSAIASALLIAVVAIIGAFWALHERTLAMAARDQAQVNARQVQQANGYVVELLSEIVDAPGAPLRSSVDILTEASRLAGLRLSSDPPQEAHVRSALGHLWLHVKRPEMADQEFVRAEQIFLQLDMQSQLEEVRIGRAIALRKSGRLADSRAEASLALKQAAATVPTDVDDEARALIELARTFIAFRDRESAVQLLQRAGLLLQSAPGDTRAIQRELQQVQAELDSPQSAAPTPPAK